MSFFITLNYGVCLLHIRFYFDYCTLFKDNQSTTHMDVSRFWLFYVLHAITRGDYDVSRDIEVYLMNRNNQKKLWILLNN